MRSASRLVRQMQWRISTIGIRPVSGSIGDCEFRSLVPLTAVREAVHDAVKDSGCQQSTFHGKSGLSRVDCLINGTNKIGEMAIRWPFLSLNHVATGSARSLILTAEEHAGAEMIPDRTKTIIVLQQIDCGVCAWLLTP